MPIFKHNIHWKAILRELGLLLHVPAMMACFSLVICLVFEEWFALIPFSCITLVCLGVGQLLCRFFSKKHPFHLWDAMIIAALGWLLCSLFAAIPFIWIAQERLASGILSPSLVILSDPVNAIFEAFSGYTTTGLTMLNNPRSLPFILQWWRSFLQWIGGLGLIVFVLALTQLNPASARLFYAEAHTEKMPTTIQKTTQWMCFIYLSYTLISILLFFVFRMPLWDAINYGLTVISTGGFTLDPFPFATASIAIQVVLILITIAGAMSFNIHFQLIRQKNWKILWKNRQQRIFIFLLFIGVVLVFIIKVWNHSHMTWMESIFNWSSTLTTAGFQTRSVSVLHPMLKLLIIIGMFIGACTGSTGGGLKIQRLLYLCSGIALRFKTLTQKTTTPLFAKNRSAFDPIEYRGMAFSPTTKNERLMSAEILFSLWLFILICGWFFLLKWAPKGYAMDALFDTVSTMSNVGLSTDLITPMMPEPSKWILIFLMWIGRLEIIPAFVLILSLPLRKYSKKRPRQKRKN